MNSKTLIGVVAVVVIVVAVAAVAVGMGGGSEDKVPSGTSIIYDGNGGTYDGKSETYAVQDTVSTVCPFVNGTCHFGGWNSSADGTGTAYREGQKVDTSSGPVRLYAQWVYQFDVTSYSNSTTIFSAVLVTGPSSAHQIAAASIVNMPTSGVAGIYIEAPEGVEYTIDENNRFIAQHGNDSYTITIGLSEGASDPQWFISESGQAMVSFSITDNIDASLSVIKNRAPQ